jgi:hypothetical protein
MSFVGHKNVRTHRRYKHKTAKILDEAIEKLRISTPISTPIRSQDDKNDA